MCFVCSVARKQQLALRNYGTHSTRQRLYRFYAPILLPPKLLTWCFMTKTCRRGVACWTWIVLFIAQVMRGQVPSAPILSDAARSTATERLALLRSVCGASASERGCDTCPAGTDFPNDQLNVKEVFYGHFLSARSEDAAVGFLGCESHASGLGGTLLLSKQSNGWKLMALRPAALVDDCKKLPARDGHDVLVCFGQDSHQGVISRYLFLLDFAFQWNREDGLDTFLMVTDSAEGCVLIGSPQELVAGTIDHVSFAPVGRIAVEARLGRITSDEFQTVAEHCRTGESTPNPLGLRLTTVPRTYTFFFNGKSVRPAPGNPAIVHTEAIPPETAALVPGNYTAADGSFSIPVPYTFRMVRDPRKSPSPACNVMATVCLFYPGDGRTQAAVEISKIDATSESACLNPEHLPGRSSRFVPGDYGYSSGLGGGPAKYGFWTGESGAYRVDQSVSRVWHGDVCYQVAANIAHEGTTAVDDDRIGHDLMRVVGEFRFPKTQ